MTTVTPVPAIVASTARTATAVAPLGLWLAVVAVGLVWGHAAVADDPAQALRAAPFAGRWEWHADAAIAGVVVVGAALALAGPAMATRVQWRALPALAAVAAIVWTAALAASGGWAHLGAPLETRYEYAPFARTIDDPGAFIATFTDRAMAYPVHVRGHPPGATLVFWLLDRVGPGGGTWGAAVVLATWGVAVAAVVLTVAVVAGRTAARRAAPFVVLAPGVVWAGTSADALFAGVVALGVTLIAFAVAATGPRSVVLAAAGGVVLATALHLTYGAVPLLAIPAAIVVHRRRFDVFVPAAGGAVVVVALWLAAGFWWIDGLAATHDAYQAGVASRRPWPYHLLAGNPAAFAIAIGPAVAVAAAHVRRTGSSVWLLPAAATAAVVLADISGLSKGEVERIWLPFVPWVATVTAALPSAGRAWLLVHAGIAVVLETWLRSPW